MKLFDLFEQDNEPMYPGEKRSVDVKIRDLTAIENKLQELHAMLHHSQSLKDLYTKDPSLEKTLTDLITKLTRQKDALNKFKYRPTASQKQVVDTIKSECSDFLSIIQQAKQFLFRGIRSYDSVIEGRSREDRSPKDSTSEISNAFDDILSRHGVKALRKNSIFTTTDLSFASSYGRNVYMIFPKNGFDFLSTTTRDLILDNWSKMVDNHDLSMFLQELHTWITSSSENSKALAGTDLKYYLDMGSKIDVMKELRRNFDEHDNQYSIPEQFNKQLKDFVTDQSVMDRFKPNTTNLQSAMASGHEILIHGEYWALKRSDWAQLAARMFIPQDESAINW